jgi:prepilin-type N-terminal cleavage/methylation domain-containing protein
MVPMRSKGAGLTGRSRRTAGFTLLELLVALTVVGVASAVFVGMFSACLGLSRANRNLAVATELAETQLAALLRAPQDFVWNNTEKTTRFLVTCPEKEPPGGYPVPVPAVALVTREAQQQLNKRYGQFRWTAFAQLSAPDAAAYEVTVAIRWMDGGRPQTLTLSSAIARALVDKTAAAPISTAGGTTP